MLTQYMAQTATLRRLTGYDERGQPEHGTPTSVPCRKSTHHKTTWTTDGQTTTLMTIWHLAIEVVPDDLLDGLRVTSVEPMRDLGAHVIGYKAVSE